MICFTTLNDRVTGQKSWPGSVSGSYCSAVQDRRQFVVPAFWKVVSLVLLDIFLHQYPSLDQQKGITKQRKVKEMGIKGQLCAKTSNRICIKFSGKVGNGPVNKRLNFGGDPDHGSWYGSGRMHCPSANSNYYCTVLQLNIVEWTRD